MADAPPIGPFKEKLEYARNVRDGVISDSRFLPVIYEFPARMNKSRAYQRAENFDITNPFLGRTPSGVKWIEDELEKEERKGASTRNIFLAKHLNIEIGMGLRADLWVGAEFWPARADSQMVKAGAAGSLANLLDRS